MLYICSRCMKSVSELSLWVLSSRPSLFLLFRPLHLKTHLFVTETKEQALPFSQQPPKDRRHHSPLRTLLLCTVFLQCQKVSNELLVSSCPCQLSRNMVSSLAIGTSKMLFNISTHMCDQSTLKICLLGRGSWFR